jgi:hypothetical protein
MTSDLLKIVKATGLILATVLALLQLWDWTLPFRQGGLRATLEYGHFRSPPDVAKEFEAIATRLGPLAIDSFAAGVRGGSALEQRRLRAAIASFVSLRTPFGPPWVLPSYSGYWKLTVRNGSTRTLQSVRVLLPGAHAAQLQRRTGRPITLDSLEDLVELGALQPRESVEIFAWTILRPTAFLAEDAQVTHSDGVSSIAILVPVGRVGQIADGLYGPLLSVLALLSIWAAVAYSAHQLGVRSARAATPTTHQADDSRGAT